MPDKKPNRRQAPEADKIPADANRQRLHPLVTEYKTKTLPRSSDRTSEFKKDWQGLGQSGRYDLSLLKTVMMHLIANDGPLPEEYLDHPLSGSYKDHRDCHVRGDWLLIYKLGNDSVLFVRTGTHSELFKK